MSSAKIAVEIRELLEQIRDNYPILEGRFSSTVTHEIKTRKWKVIFDFCKARGHTWTIGQTETFLRVTKWPGIKQDVNKKFKESRDQTDSDESRLTDMDNFVLDFIGRETPGLVGLDVPENYPQEDEEDELARRQLEHHQQEELLDHRSSVPVDFLEESTFTRSSQSMHRMVVPGGRSKKTASAAPSTSSRASPATTTPYMRQSDASSKTMKELQMMKKALLERTIYKTELEIYELEVRLGKEHKYELPDRQ